MSLLFSPDNLQEPALVAGRLKNIRLLSESSEVQFWTFPHLLKLNYLLLVSIYNLSCFFNQRQLFTCLGSTLSALQPK